MDATGKISPKELIKKRVERDMYMKFYEKGRNYMVDENLIIGLYNVYTKNREETYIMTHEDKVEVTKAYPSLFNYRQKGFMYIITRKNNNN